MEMLYASVLCGQPESLLLLRYDFSILKCTCVLLQILPS